MIDMKRFASVGLDKDVILSEDVVQTISQFLRLGVATDRPADGIIFWSFRNIPKIFKNEVFLLGQQNWNIESRILNNKCRSEACHPSGASGSNDHYLFR